jgi:hypothetical protein
MKEYKEDQDFIRMLLAPISPSSLGRIDADDIGLNLSRCSHLGANRQEMSAAAAAVRRHFTCHFATNRPGDSTETGSLEPAWRSASSGPDNDSRGGVVGHDLFTISCRLTLPIDLQKHTSPPTRHEHFRAP